MRGVKGGALSPAQLRLLEEIARCGHLSTKGRYTPTFTVLAERGLIRRRPAASTGGRPLLHQRYEMTAEGEQYLAENRKVVEQVDEVAKLAAATRELLADANRLAIQQRLLDALAAQIQSTRRQLDGCGSTLGQIERATFYDGPARGKLFEDLKEAELALARAARTVAEFGGRA